MLLEDLLEQEKREQEKQQTMSGSPSNVNTSLPPLSDADFERLRADILNNPSMSPTPTSRGNYLCILQILHLLLRISRIEDLLVLLFP